MGSRGVRRRAASCGGAVGVRRRASFKNANVVDGGYDQVREYKKSDCRRHGGIRREVEKNRMGLAAEGREATFANLRHVFKKLAKQTRCSHFYG